MAMPEERKPGAHVESMARAPWDGRREAVVLKGSKRGLVVVLDEEGAFDELVAALRRKLSRAGRFFSGARVALDPGGRRATWAEWTELLSALRESGLVPAEGPAAGGAASPAERGGRPAPGGARAVVGSAELARDVAGAGVRPTRARGPGSRQVPAGRTLLVRRTLRSGQRVAYDGHVVVRGDVNPGAEVIASGDIVVMGALRGVAHAGARGDEDAVVVALELMPLQLRIAHQVARSPEVTSTCRGPEVARIRDGTVELLPYPAALEEGTSEWQDG